MQLRIVLRQAFVARLLMLEEILHHVKRMLDLGTKTHFEFLIQQRQVFFPTFGHRLDRRPALGNAKRHGVRHRLEFVLDFGAFFDTHIARIGPHALFLAMQQAAVWLMSLTFAAVLMTVCTKPD